MSIAFRDKTTSTSQLAVASDGSLTASIKGNLSPFSRSMDYWTVDQFSFAVNTETLLTVTESVNGATGATFSSRLITAGKTMRLLSISTSIENGGTVPVLSRVYLGIRINPFGAATIASQLVYRSGITVGATAKAIVSYFDNFPDGTEFFGDGVKQIGVTAICPEYVVTTQLPKITLGILVYEY